MYDVIPASHSHRTLDNQSVGCSGDTGTESRIYRSLLLARIASTARNATRCGLFLYECLDVVLYVCLSVGLCACHAVGLCKNGRTGRDAVWDIDARGPR